ncbi:hypothetical protein QCM77_18890 [Bradyrhizobium sp. SSUT18]|uniref:hypothetical protein n=1 Tax=Bradyrhizobium sp. SSUT18 TaxID=3040602 RepID=UPI00244BE90A|nr:hypothetical protein [Bradyrhizobium sp. SSUT18]MDH2402009.1 hypothetical protein [Bradyrhizobium sp. SSUT18]
MNANEAHTFMTRLESGDSLRMVVGGANGTPICSAEAFKKHCELNPEWGAKALGLVEHNRKLADNRKGKKIYTETSTHCRRGHVLAETLITDRRGRRYCRSCNHETIRRGIEVTPAKIEEIKRAFITGMSGTDITSRAGNRKSIVSMPTLRRLKIEHPEIAQLQYQYARTQQARNTLTSSQAVVRITPVIIKVLDVDTPRPSSEIEVYIPRAGDVEWLYSLTPRYLSRSARDDIVNSTFLELSERRIDRAGVPACVKTMVTAHNRDNPLKAYGDIRTPLPLDAPAYLDGTMSRVEIVSESLWS